MARALGNSAISTKSPCSQVWCAPFSQCSLARRPLRLASNFSPDYRIPQALHQLGCLKYSPPLESHIRQRKLIPSGSTWETEIRATSIWCVELIRQAIERQYPEARAMFQPTKSPKPADNHHTNGYVDAAHLDAHKKCTTQKHWKQKSVNEPTASGVNAILIDFFLYDTMKELELKQEESIPHHRTRSIWY